jgi:autotransporter-associated beta strand protein
VSVNNVGAQNATLKIVSGADWGIRDFNIGEAAGARVAVYHSGTLTADGGVNIGNGASSYAYYNLSGGTLGNTGGDLAVGRGNSSIGVMDVTGGSLTTASWIVLGRNGGTASGLLNVTGGSVSSGANNIGLNWGGSAGAISILNVGGGAGAATVTGVANAGNYLDVSIANVAGQIGVVNVRPNGTLTVAKVQASGAASTALFNFDGGTLKATTNNAGVNFMNSGNMDAVTVYSSGGTIDNNGTSITIGNALGAATGNGVTSVAVTDGGSGYIGAPLVTFTDGTGNPATGYAVMTDDGTGNGTYKVSSIVISSPGTYTVDPTAATLSGGGATIAATLGTITSAANTSGGMTFQGSGTTTLSGYLSYGGGTKVLGGTLVLNAGTGLPYPGGDLVVSNATLNLDASSGTMSANNISVGSTLNLTVSPYANAISGTGNMTVGNNTTNNLSYGTVSSAPSAAVIKATGTLTKGTNIVINVSATGLQPGWIVPLIEADSTAMTTNGFVLGALPAGIKAVLTNSTANTLDLLVTSAGQLLTWHGSEDGINPAINWDIATSTNWYSLPSFALAQYQQYLGNTIGDNVTFGDSALYTDGTNHVNLPTTVVPATVIFSASSPYEVHGAGGIGGATSVALTNNYAAVYLNTSNSYTGGTIVSGGTLVITNDNALGAPAGGLTLGGGSLQLNASINTSRAITVTTNSAIGVLANSIVQLSGALSGTGSLTKSDNGTLAITSNNTFAGAMKVSGGMLNLSSDLAFNNLLVGNALGSAVVNQNGGNVTVNGGGGDNLCVGNIAGAFGYYNAQGGTLTANGLAVGGENNTGSGFTGTGGDGIMEINGTAVNDIGWLVMARGATAETGVLNMFSGSLTYAGGGLQCNWGAGQTSIINIMGGSISSTNTPVSFRNAGNTGVLNLKGGLLQPSAITGYGILNFNGGTLKPIANNNNFVSAVRANVYSGGATIDDGGYAVTINQPLLAPEGYGVSSISLSDGGSGYIAPPIVTISGGTGSNATAIATISGGSVTGITVTSPGNGFDSSDSLYVSFSGGGNSVTQPTVSAVNLAVNVSGGLIKLGSGTMILNGADTYTGNTVINAGKLLVTPAHQATNSVSVADGAGYGVQLTAGPATVTNAAITLASGSTTLSFSLGNNGNPGQPLLVCGALTNNGTLSVAVGGNSSLLTVGSAIPLVKYSGSIAGAGSLNPTIAAPRGASLTLSNDATGHTLYAVVNAAGSGIVWAGTNSAPGLANLWDLNSTTNWLIGGTPTDYQETSPPGDAVAYNDLGSGTVLLSNTVSPASVTISNSAVNYTFQGTGGISGTTALTKQGSGTLTMNLANTYTGGTTFSNGTLLVQGNSTPTGAGSTVTSGPLGAGALNLNGGTFSFVAGANYTVANNVTVGGDISIAVSTAGNTEVLNGNWSGSGNLTLVANGTTGQWQFGGDNSGYTGTFTESSGNTSLAFNSANSGSASAAWVFNNPVNQRTRLGFGEGTISFGSLSGNGSIANVAASGAATVSVGALNSSTTFSGVLGGSSAGQGQNINLLKIGTGTLTMSGANTYTGTTTVSDGTLIISAPNSASATGEVTVNDGATFGVTASSDAAYSSPVSLSVGSGTGATLQFGVVSTTTAPLNPATVIINGTATINIASCPSTIGTSYPLFTNYSSGTLVLGSQPAGITGQLSVSASTVYYQVTNAFADVWTAVVNTNWDTATANWTNSVGGNLYEAGFPVQFDDSANGASPLLVNIPSPVSPASITVSNTAKSYTIGGQAISGSTGLTKDGTNTLALTGTNMFTGPMAISAGAVAIGGAGQLGGGNYSSAITNNGLFDYDSSANQSLTGIISGTGTLLKTGAGTLTLSAVNSYLGGTVVGNGMLVLTVGGSAGTLRGALTINPGATVQATASDGIGYGTVATPVNIYGGTFDNASGLNEGYITTFNLMGGLMTNSVPTDSTHGFNFNGSSSALNSLATNIISTVSGNMILRAGGLHINTALGTVPGGVDLLISGVISGGNGFQKDGAGTLKLAGINTYSGATTVSDGTLLVSGATAGGAITVNGGVLGGTGSIGGAVTVNNGAGLAPGNSIGTLTISGNITLNASSTNVFEVDGTSAISDQVVAGAAVSYGGVLKIVSTGTFTNGQTFTLFSGAGAANAGNFASIEGSPGSGLGFTFTNGVLSVVPSGPTGPVNMTNTYDAGTHVLSLSWPAGQGWRLQMQTNSLSTGLSTNWNYITDGSISSTNITVDPAKPTVFYRLQYP